MSVDKETFVYVDFAGGTHLVGRLWSHTRRDRESATFEYSRSWLADKNRFSLEPALHLSPGPHHTAADRAMFGAIGDSAPDRWGRVLMRRAEWRRAERIKETPRTLREIDYLLMVDDETRQGALRFARQEGGPFLADDAEKKIPPLIELPKLLRAADRVSDNTDTEDDLRLLLAPGSSLGGARPKASVRDRDGQLAMAKFPNRNDDIDVMRWEAVALTLAAKAKIEVPSWRLENVARRPVLILRRFDRSGAWRRPYLSAMSMIGARDNEQRSYMEFVDALRRHGATAKCDIRELWRRIVFNVLIANTDDHLRNHGFLYRGIDGWTLAPAFDLNPTPADLKPRILSTAINMDDSMGSIDLAYEVAAYFETGPAEAKKIVREVAKAVSNWRKFAVEFGVAKREIDRMATAFEYPIQKGAARAV